MCGWGAKSCPFSHRAISSSAECYKIADPDPQIPKSCSACIDLSITSILKKKSVTELFDLMPLRARFQDPGPAQISRNHENQSKNWSKICTAEGSESPWEHGRCSRWFLGLVQIHTWSQKKIRTKNIISSWRKNSKKIRFQKIKIFDKNRKMLILNENSK